MVRRLALQVIAKEPQPVQPQRKRGHQLALAPNVIENQKHHQFEDDRWWYRWMPHCSVQRLDLVIHEFEVDGRLHLPKQMLLGNPITQCDRLAKHRRLGWLLPTHHRTTSADMSVLCHINHAFLFACISSLFGQHSREHWDVESHNAQPRSADIYQASRFTD